MIVLTSNTIKLNVEITGMRTPNYRVWNLFKIGNWN